MRCVSCLCWCIVRTLGIGRCRHCRRFARPTVCFFVCAAFRKPSSLSFSIPTHKCMTRTFSVDMYKSATSTAFPDGNFFCVLLGWDLIQFNPTRTTRRTSMKYHSLQILTPLSLCLSLPFSSNAGTTWRGWWTKSWSPTDGSRRRPSGTGPRFRPDSSGSTGGRKRPRRCGRYGRKTCCFSSIGDKEELEI